MQDKVDYGIPMSDRTLSYKRNCLIISSILIAEKFLPKLDISTLQFMNIELGQNIYLVLLIGLIYFFTMYFLQGYPEACQWIANINVNKINKLEYNFEADMRDEHDINSHMSNDTIRRRDALRKLNREFERKAHRVILS